MAFLENFRIGQFVPQQSIVHQLDPRTKILMILIPVVFAALTLNPLIYMILLGFLLIVFFLSGLPFSVLIRNLRTFIWLFVLIFILQVVFTSAFFEIIYYFSFFHLSSKGFLNGLIYSLRLAVFIFGAVVLILTTSPMDLTDGLVNTFSWLKKLKVPVQELGLVAMISLRFVPLLVEEAFNLRKAQLSRGASFQGNLIQRTRKTLPLLIPLFVSSFRKADELALALDARGFRSGQERGSYRKLEFRKIDYIFWIMILILSILCLLIKGL
jgi:energy-coupling factor transport system permease protein